jgi:transposase
LFAANAPLLTIHTMKEKFKDFWENDSMQESIALLNEWCTNIENSCVKELKKIATTLMHHRHGLLRYHFHRLPFGIIERINNKIKTLMRQGHGFSDMTYFKLRLYHLNHQKDSFTGWT